MLYALFGPSIFCRTPQEHLECQWRKNIQLPHTPPERHVRVYLFLEWQEGRDDKELLDNLLYLKADVPLEPTGKLSLLRIREMWGLEDCIPIDQCRRMAFKSADSDYLSPIAIGVLAGENGVLKLFGRSCTPTFPPNAVGSTTLSTLPEPRPSDATVAMREKRMQYVRRYQAETTWLYETANEKVDEVLSSKTMLFVFVVLVICIANVIIRFIDGLNQSETCLWVPWLEFKNEYAHNRL
ncbi:hypothetical protein PISMIDRAFT_680355 [Pisolithus microcarpus 441]|uniref:Uncharacterized protein n=1 Tax=Pisolithus microcarpus 441 TaxID=765257 RepID=A0A0C9Z8H2_9AGAM|nr:hypothetical protein PISMIDRAFT_680355 [Pisolithus microcarpus 441]